MKSLKVVKIAALCGMFLLISFHEAQSADYSLQVVNEMYKGNNDVGNTCNPVTLAYWGTNGSGSRVSLPSGLGYRSQTLTVNNAGSCSSMDLTIKCHYLKTNYVNKGRASETSYSSWVDEDKSQSLACGCHGVVVGLQLVTQGSSSYQALKITCQ